VIELALTKCVPGMRTRPKTDGDTFLYRSSHDSSLKGAGFELSVPRRERRFLSGNGNRHRGDKR
jgi:hypothetical protein